MERVNRARMLTYTPKLGDVVKWPNGIEMNYDVLTESVVVLHPNEAAVLTIRPVQSVERRNEGTDGVEADRLTGSRTWLIGRVQS